MGTNGRVGTVSSFGGDRHPTEFQLPGGGFWSSVSQLIEHLGDRLERARQRRALLELDDHLLQDIGITRQEAIFQSRKGLWGG